MQRRKERKKEDIFVFALLVSNLRPYGIGGTPDPRYWILDPPTSAEISDFGFRISDFRPPKP
jgi:hypothetical protein